MAPLALLIPFGVGYLCMKAFQRRGRSALGGFALGALLSLFFSLLGILIALAISYSLSDVHPVPVATFNARSAWMGRRIFHAGRQFTLEGFGVVPPQALLDYDREAYLDWESADLRAWVERLVAGAAGPAAAEPGAAMEPRGEAAPRRAAPPEGERATDSARTQATRPRVWFIALIVAVVVIPTGILMVIALPGIRGESGDAAQDRARATREIAVGHGLQKIQAGIEAYAADHRGVPPAAGKGFESKLAPYVHEWPRNPYTGAPMTEGRDEGGYAYARDRSTKSYSLAGYGDGGELVGVLPPGAPAPASTDGP